MINPLLNLTDQELLHSLQSLAREERGRTVAVLKHLEEMDRRRLAEKTGFPSLFEYCVRELRYAHGTAARRIHAARAAAKFPILHRMLERGLLSVSTVSILAPHLTWDGHRRLLRAAAGKSTREVEALVASFSPAPPALERVRFIGTAVAPQPDEPGLFMTRNATGPLTPPGAPPTTPLATLHGAEPLAASAPPGADREKTLRVQFIFTADERLLRKVERAKELLRHKCPAGRLEDVFETAITALLDELDPEQRPPRRARRPRAKPPPSAEDARRRAISPALRDAVWRRDGGRCVFRSPDGRVCGARARLQIDHVAPWARGGVSNDPRNLRLLCRAHNLLEARLVFGDATIDAAVVRERRRGGRRRSAGRG